MTKPPEQGISIRRLLQFARPEVRTLLLGSVFLALGSGMGLAYPQAIKRIVDETLKASEPSHIDKVVAVVFCIFLIQAIAAACRYYLFTLAGERIVLSLRQALFDHLMEQEIGFFDSRRTGELMSRLSSDTTVLQNTLSVNISMAVRNLTGTIGGTILLLVTSAKLTLTMLVVVPPIALGGAVFGRRIRAFSKDAQDALAFAGTVAEETLSGIRIVRAFSQEKYEQLRYGRSLKQSFSVAKQRISQIAYFTGGASLLGYIAVTAVLWQGGRLVVAGQMSIGELTSFLIYMFIVGFSVGALGSLWTDFMAATGASKRIFEIFDRSPQIHSSRGEVLAEVKGRVEFNQVSFFYPSRSDVEVLHDVTFAIEPGSLVALVGPSGSGKSTIASLIPRFYDPASGEIKVDNRDIRELDGKSLRRHIGIVAQEPVLVSETIAENIRYGKSEATQEEIEAAARAANAHEFISKFPEGYQTLVGERGLQLSGGQKQRVAIARAVLRDPKILILDEATSALDAESEHLVQEALERLMEGRTTLVIAHRLSTVRNAEDILVLEAGRVKQRGNHESLMKDRNGLYFRLVERQFVAGE